MRNTETIEILSVYKKNGKSVMLPSRMSIVTPDFKRAILSIQADVEAEGGELILSDLFRSHEMQHQAHMDYVNGKKKAYSPPAGSGMHEAARAMDIDTGAIRMNLKRFWEIAAEYGVTPIIDTPSKGRLESWHFDKRGSHGIVYNYYKAKKGTNMKPYQAMAVSAILAIGIDVDTNDIGDQDFLKGRNKEAFIQSGLIRLGHNIGNIDGSIGGKTMDALKKQGIIFTDLQKMYDAVDTCLKKSYPEEYC